MSFETGHRPPLQTITQDTGPIVEALQASFAAETACRRIIPTAEDYATMRLGETLKRASKAAATLSRAKKAAKFMLPDGCQSFLLELAEDYVIVWRRWSASEGPGCIKQELHYPVTCALGGLVIAGQRISQGDLLTPREGSTREEPLAYFEPGHPALAIGIKESSLPDLQKRLVVNSGNPPPETREALTLIVDWMKHQPEPATVPAGLW